MSFVNAALPPLISLRCVVGPLASIPPSLLSLHILHASHTPPIHLLLGGLVLLCASQTSVSDRILRVDLIHDIMRASVGYKYHPACDSQQATNMSNCPSPAMFTQPSVIKPYAFPDPSCQARPIHTIDPQLNVPPPSRNRRAKFSVEDLEWLVRLAAEKEPWAKPHGQIRNSWKEILDQLQSEGRFQTSSVTTIQNKLNALIAWQEVFSIL